MHLRPPPAATPRRHPQSDLHRGRAYLLRPQPGRRLPLPAEALARLTDLGAVAADEPQPHEPMRVGQSLPYEVTDYRLTESAAALLADLDDVARCRVCGCTEDAPCPGGCCWVPDP